MVGLVEGWQTRTEQKLAFAGCLAAVLTLRHNPMRVGPKLRDFTHKIIGYGSAAVLFSGIQESCRAARGRHDFINSAVSGAVTGGTVVGHYQGPQYRLLGVLTWGVACGVLHALNSLVRPRYILEDYLIREGLLSPQVARVRASREAELETPQAAQQDVLLASLAVRDRELRELNERLATASSGAPSTYTGFRTVGTLPSRGAAASPAPYGPAVDEYEVPDDDPGYQAWLRNSGLDAEALLQSPATPEAKPWREQQDEGLDDGAEGRAKAAGTTGSSSSGGSSRGGSGSQSGASRTSASGAVAEGDGVARGSDGMVVPEDPKRQRSWTRWLTPWRWRTQGRVNAREGSAGKQAEN